MADIIQLLPESIANQIAAGEVIQRPASVVKELMENAIDAQSTEITVIIKDSGKTLIQIIDNGKGMSEMDARMSFERHATSKIKKADDLFKISTMGFRGEALASIASIAHVDMMTATSDMKVATHLRINGSNVAFQKACQHPQGTSIAVKQLFFNVPARRKFLKSDAVELRHIIEEFKRIAIIHPEISFKVVHDGNELYMLTPGNFRQRVVSVFGKKINEHLLPVAEETDRISIQGFVGGLDLAKKSKSDQYLFVNQRFIKSNYINHAVKMAYAELIPKDYYPFYVVNIDIDPALIDINVHPTKHEIKFEEERLIYNFIKVSVRHSLGRYKITPMIDFEAPPSQSMTGQVMSSPNIKRPSKAEVSSWNDFYNTLGEDGKQSVEPQREISLNSQITDYSEGEANGEASKNQQYPIQVHGRYILHQVKSGFILIDQKNAHERILYERYAKQLKDQIGESQKLLFPLSFKYSPEKHLLILNIRDKLNVLGFEIEDFGHQSIIVHGLPAGMESNSIEPMIDGFLEAYQNNLEFKMDINDNLARSLAMHSSMKQTKYLGRGEMQNMIDQLFACELPYTNPRGQKCVINFSLDQLKNMFES